MVIEVRVLGGGIELGSLRLHPVQPAGYLDSLSLYVFDQRWALQRVHVQAEFRCLRCGGIPGDCRCELRKEAT